MSYTSINIIYFLRVAIKEHQILFAKYLVIGSITFGIFGCKIEPEKPAIIKIKNVEVANEKLLLHPNEGKWYYNKEPFSGYAVKYYPDSSLSEKVGFHEGKREGFARGWHPNGKLYWQLYHHANHRNGTEKYWTSDGVLVSESHFVDDIVHGVQTQWYPSGKIFKRMNIVNGVEEGLQQTWWENGKLYVNYEAKNGRVFGLKRSTLCYELKNEVVQK
jgi:antitoxin component YwqK of YwqJK toxin-antitoxin module